MAEGLYRSMKKDEDGLPVVEASAKGLGVRSGRPKHNDVDLTDTGEVVLNGKGMSVASEWRKLKSWQIPSRLRVQWEGATGPEYLACFRLGDYRFINQEINDDLAVKTDGPTHAVISPRRQVLLKEFEQALAATRKDWEVDES